MVGSAESGPGILFLCHIAKENFGSEIRFDSVAIKKGKILKEMERTDSFFEGSDLFFWLDLLNPKPCNKVSKQHFLGKAWISVIKKIIFDNKSC